jgi:transposase
MDRAWAGIDAGKEFHWAHVMDASGTQLLSRRVENDEADLSKLIEEALSLAQEIIWAVDQPGGSAALLLTLLWERGQRIRYVPGLTVDRARETYRGESKTDAKNAYVIADQARMRADLGALEPGETELAELELLLAGQARTCASKLVAGADQRFESARRPSSSAYLSGIVGIRESWFIIRDLLTPLTKSSGG